MTVYLQRHCEPQPGERLNAQRPLTVRGIQQADDMAEFMRRQVGRVDIVISSPFEGAKQTADIMAKALGSYVATTAELQPDADPKEAWAEVKRLAQSSDDVLVVTHHPLIGYLIDYLTRNSGIGHDFQHGSIAAVATDPAAMRWLVNHEITAAQNVLEAEESAVLADVLELADAALELAESMEAAGRSLKHPDHARLIRPIARKVKRLMAGYFERQGEEILKAVKPWLNLHMKESADTSISDAAATAATILPDTLQPFLLSVSTQESNDYRGLIQDAIRKAEAQLEAELRSGSSIPETAMSRYLNDNSLSKLTGNFAETTKQRLRSAISEAVQNGGTADDIVDAIQETTENFSSVRANLIAQTEVNDAYNFGRRSLALASGLDEKTWICDGPAPCIECLANQAQGYIGIDEEFLSGDQMPTLHPMCYCSLDFRKVS